ncbi:MAG: ABC transporter substrate-binding protein [Proteobacteria bacterium]|nr:ABC transporter substrate-binding protein [Pseudomonadota bacterium]
MISSRHQRKLAATLLAACAMQCAPAALAMQDGKPVIGFLAFEAGGCRNLTFHRGLAELGYVDGKNMVFVCRHSEGRFDRLDAMAAELVAVKPDVIVLLGHTPAKAGQRLTRTIPIVISASGEPVAMGFAQSLARPGGNITGVSYYNTELNGKRLELLGTLLPGLRRVAMVANANVPEDLTAAYQRDSEAAAKVLGFQLKLFSYTQLDELDRTFEQLAAWRAQAVLVAPLRELPAEIKRLADLSLRHRLPVMHSRAGFPQAGGLMSYGPDYDVLIHRTASFVDRILKGAKPADLPFEQPARFELHINLTTARALGLTVPESLLLRADKVIE